MAKAELVSKNPHASTWQAIKAALQMRFPGFGGGGGLTSGFSWRIDDDFTRNILRSVARFAGTTIDFAQEAGEPELSSLVMAYVNWLGRSLTEAPLVVMAMGTGGKETPNYMHPGLKVLRRPNPFYPGSTLLQAFATSWGIKGNGYWLKARNGRLDKGRNGRGEVFQLWHVPYWMMDARWPPVDSNVFISYYEYLLDGRPIPIDPADVVHFRNGLSDDGRNGVSPLDPVYREIYKDNTEANYGALLARNGAVPPVVLSIKEAAHEPATEDLKAYKESYQASTQGDERGKVFVSNYPIEVTKLGLTPAEMDLSAAHYFNEQRFCAVVGVDVRVLGFGSSMQGSTFSNQADARKAAVENVLCPLWSYLEDELTHQLGPDLGLNDNERFAFDLTRVRVLREDKDALYKRVTTAYKVGGWMKRNEAREEAGLPITPEDDGYYDDLKPAPPQLTSEPVAKLSNKEREIIASGKAYFNSLLTGLTDEEAIKKASYFSVCPRDDKGRCEESGGRTVESAAAYKLRTEGKGEFLSYKEHKANAAYAQAKIDRAPVPSQESVAKAQKELELARQGKIRAGGESRGGGSKDRRRQRENLFKEFGGEEKGYIGCHGCGLKLHHTPPEGSGFGRLERGKIFVKCQGGGYQLANLLPECFGCNRSRNDAQVRKDNPC